MSGADFDPDEVARQHGEAHLIPPKVTPPRDSRTRTRVRTAKAAAERAPEVEPPAFADLAATLTAVVAFLRAFVRFTSDAQPVAVVLWIAHAYLVEQFAQSPILSITSAVMQSGKTRLLDAIELLVPRPWRLIMPSEAVVFRKIEQDSPTLMLDEADAVFGSRRDFEGLRAMLNAGNRPGTRVPRVAAEGRSFRLIEFSIYCAKVIAGLGNVPPTVADRSIPVRLERRVRSEHVEPFRQQKADERARPIREALAYYTAQLDLREADPAVPAELDDRAQDSWQSLLAVADAAGGPWPEEARKAARELHGARRDDEAFGVLMLRDCRAAFDDRRALRIGSADLLADLVARDESPWGDMGGRPLTLQGLAKLLRPFRIAPKVERVDGQPRRGYERADFEAAFARYLAPRDEPLSAAPRPVTPLPRAPRNDEIALRDGPGNGVTPPARPDSADGDNPMYRAALEVFGRPDGPEASPPF